MSTISRDQFISSFQGQALDLDNLSPELQEQLHAAGIDASELRQMAGGDGVIRGEAELGKLFLAIDTLDRDGSYRSIATADRNGHATRAGGLITELQAEVENSRLRSPVGRTAPTAPKEAMPATQAPWLDIARGEIGQKEKKGTAVNNPRIVEYHASTKGKFTNDETAWCSSFVNWVMEKSGHKGTDSARALSWQGYGTKSDGPAVGAIAVIDYGGGKGHVGFVVGQHGDDIVILGGNQKDSVMQRTFPRSAIKEYRLPPGYQPPPAPLPEVNLKNDKPASFSETR